MSAYCIGGDDMASIYMEIDASELMERMERLHDLLTPERFQRIMYDIYKRSAGTIRKAVKTDLPHQYTIKPGEVGAAIGNPRITGWSCAIPIRAPKRKIGPQYKARGGRKGWNSLKGPYNITANIVKSGTSTLSQSMECGQPPFRNIGSKLGNIQVYTRTSKKRGPLFVVSGVAIPQMPMNRSKEEVQHDVLETMKKRLEHEIQRAIARC